MSERPDHALWIVAQSTHPIFGSLFYVRRGDLLTNQLVKIVFSIGHWV